MSRAAPLAVAALAVTLAVTTTGVLLTSPAGTTPRARSSVSAVEVVRAWDVRRAEAWAEGDVRLLASLYTQESPAGRRDRAMLRAWTARGLTVSGLRTQLIDVRELARTPTTWTLRVTDRIVGGSAVGAGSNTPLPADRPTTRTLRLRLVAGEWLVAGVS